MECGEFGFVLFKTIAAQGVWPTGRRINSVWGLDLDQATLKE
jgi:hypothetical protein